MGTDALITRRFVELEAQIDALRVSRGDFSSSYDTSAWQQWATSAQHLLRVAFGEISPHYQNFSAAYEKCHGREYEVDALKGVFRAAKADYEGGYAFSMQALISGEVYGDFVALAKRALSEGAKDVGAVLACAALEDALKRFALMNGLDVSGKSMQDIYIFIKYLFRAFHPVSYDLFYLFVD